MLKRLWRILRLPPGELNFKCLAFRPSSPSPVRHSSLKTCEMWCFRSGLSPGLLFLCLRISDGFLVDMFVCARVVSTRLIISFLVQTPIWREAAYQLWKKAGWLKQPNWCVKNEKNKQEKREEEKKQQLFLRSQRPPSARSLVIISEFAQKHLRTCVGVVFTSLKAESRAHENSHAAETNPYHKKNNREKYNHVLEFFYKLTKSESWEESLPREAADWLFVLGGWTSIGGSELCVSPL